MVGESAEDQHASLDCSHGGRTQGEIGPHEPRIAEYRSVFGQPSAQGGGVPPSSVGQWAVPVTATPYGVGGFGVAKDPELTGTGWYEMGHHSMVAHPDRWGRAYRLRVDLPSTLERATECELVGVLEIATHG